MSYCRFSCNDYQCDLYCYEDVMGGWTTCVANSRYVFKEPLPPPEPFTPENTPAWHKRDEKVMKMVHDAHTEPLGLPYDGQCFNDPTIEEFRSRVAHLIEVGYRVPEKLLERIDEEVKHRA